MDRGTHNAYHKCPFSFRVIELYQCLLGSICAIRTIDSMEIKILGCIGTQLKRNGSKVTFFRIYITIAMLLLSAMGSIFRWLLVPV